MNLDFLERSGPGMNYFAHGHRFLDDPYFLAGTAVPDWLNVVDRKVRVRPKSAQQWVDDSNPQLAAVARGIVQHLHDDNWFHRTRTFSELSLQFTVEVRDRLGQDAGMRPSFVGHIMVELLLDAVIAERDPELLERYFQSMTQVDPSAVEEAVNKMATRPAQKLGFVIQRFCEVKFLWEYLEDSKLLQVLNRVMGRVGLNSLPDSLREWFPEARRIVREHREALLTPEAGK